MPSFFHVIWQKIRSTWYRTGILQCMCPANERRHYIVTPSLIGWAHNKMVPVEHQYIPRIMHMLHALRTVKWIDVRKRICIRFWQQPPFFIWGNDISVCKTVVTPLLTQQNYCCVAVSHRIIFLFCNSGSILCHSLPWLWNMPLALWFWCWSFTCPTNDFFVTLNSLWNMPLALWFWCWWLTCPMNVFITLIKVCDEMDLF